MFGAVNDGLSMPGAVAAIAFVGDILNQRLPVFSRASRLDGVERRDVLGVAVALDDGGDGALHRRMLAAGAVGFQGVHEILGILARETGGRRIGAHALRSVAAGA